MRHTCFGLDECKMENYDKPPHYFSPLLKQAPASDELVLTVMYMNEKDKVNVGWGMRFIYCPACGEHLGDNMKKLQEKYAKRFSKIDKKKVKTKDDFDEALKLYELLEKAMSLLAEMAGMIIDKTKELDNK